MLNYLITGGFGYIGSVLTETLLQDPYSKVTVLDNLMYDQQSLLPLCGNKRLKFIHGDVRNEAILKEAMKEADYIVPLAAIVGAPACDREQQLATDVNYSHIKFICDNISVSQGIVIPNTNSGYGTGQGTSYCTEETPLLPISHYGRTKCDAEKAVLDCNGISLRLATVFGLSYRMRLDLLVNNFTYKALSDGYLVLFEKDFKRNYIHVRDVTNAFLKVIDEYPGGQAYNVGLSSANISKYELALKIKEYVPNLSIQFDEFSKDKDQRNYIVDNSKIEALGWKPQYSLDDGIQELIKAYPMLFANQQQFTNL